MVRSKKIRERGKLRLSRYFKKFSDGDKVAFAPDRGVRINFPERIVGRSGTVLGSRGNFKLVKLVDGGKQKQYIVHPVHLKKLA